MATATEARRRPADPHDECTQLVDLLDAYEIMACGDSEYGLKGTHLAVVFRNAKERAKAVLAGIAGESVHG